MSNWWIIKRYDNFAGGWYPWSNGGWVHQRQKVATVLALVMDTLAVARPVWLRKEAQVKQELDDSESVRG
jgi:hypothetical protein